MKYNTFGLSEQNRTEQNFIENYASQATHRWRKR